MTADPQIHIDPRPAGTGTDAAETWRRRAAHEKEADRQAAHAQHHRGKAHKAAAAGDRKAASRQNGFAIGHAAAARWHRRQATAEHPRPI